MSDAPAIRVFNDPQATSGAAAEALALALREAVKERGRADWATTGGSTPVGIYRALRVPPLRGLVPWASVQVWWGDDRFVPRDDPLSNVLPLDRELLGEVPLLQANVHAMPMDEVIAAGGEVGLVAAIYDGELRAAGLPIADSGFPILDVVLVGLGGDGHVLSVFPGSPVRLLRLGERRPGAGAHRAARPARQPASGGARGCGGRWSSRTAAGKRRFSPPCSGPEGRASLAGTGCPARRRDLVPRPRRGGLPAPVNPLEVRSRDGTPIAVFEIAAAAPPIRNRAEHPPLLLVHGATADHTTWRAVGPRFAVSRRVFAMDRRGRGASGDAPDYAIEREYEDLAAVADALGASAPTGSVDVAGHSYGGRCALGASLLTSAIRRLVVYEGAPVPRGMSYRPPGLVEAVRGALERGDKEGALTTFLAGIVGMSDGALEAYRRDPVWPARVEAAHTILREIEAEATDAASIEAFAGVRIPVLLILGSISRSPFRIGTDALAARLADARVAVIEGAAHAAHHTHAGEFVQLVEAFPRRPAGTPVGATSRPSADSVSPGYHPGDGRHGARRAALLPRPRRRHRRRDDPQPRRRRARPAAVSRLPDRRSRRARHVSGGREPALDRRVGPDTPRLRAPVPAR